MRSIGRRRKLFVAALALALLAVAGPAQALRIRAGDLIVIGDGGFTPKTLPRKHDAPITVRGGGRIETVSHQLPPILKKIIFEFDRHGHVETIGLPKCRPGQLQATNTKMARRACGDAIVGKGFGKALVAFPEQAPFTVSSPITVFNSVTKHGNPTVLAHAYTTVPVPTTFIVPIEIQRIHNGLYGYRTEAKIPRIAGGAGIPIAGSLEVGRKWHYKGKLHSFINARCETGRLQARGNFSFDNGDLLKGTFFRPCKVRPE